MRWTAAGETCGVADASEAAPRASEHRVANGGTVVAMAPLAPDQLAALEERLRPGGASDSGFLAPQEKLVDVLERDRRALAALGLTCGQVADRLEQVLGRAERRVQLARRGTLPDDGRGVAMVEPQLEVGAEHSAGWQECPFLDEIGQSCPVQPWSTADYQLTNTSSGKTVRIPGLLPHLVRAHSFFEGDVPYRVDPTTLAELMTLSPSSHAGPEWRTERVWALFTVTRALPWFGIGGPRWYWQPELMALLKHDTTKRPTRWDERVDLAPRVTACRSGDWCVLVARKEGTLAAGARLDGSELELPRDLGQGTTQLRRVVRSYVALEEE